MYDSIKKKIKKILLPPDPETINMKRYLAELDYDWSEFSFNDFISWLSGSIGEPILLLPQNMPANICGAYVISPDRHHLILFDQDLPLILRDVTILHEIAHLLCGHQTAQLDHDQMQILQRNDESDIVRTKLIINRSPKSKTDRQEKEAEALALLIASEVKKNKYIHKVMIPSIYDHLVFFWR